MPNTSTFASGLSWNTLTVVLQVVIQLIYTGLFARMVTPDTFMLMGLVLGIMGFAEIFSQVGIGPALIQRKEVHQQHLNGAFYTALILGLTFTLIFICSAPAIAAYYSIPELSPITQFVCTSFTISALAVVPRNMMMKQMRFKTMFKASMLSIVGGNLIVGLILAYCNYGVWAYAWALFAQNTIMTLALWWMQPVKLTVRWEWKYTAELMRYGIGSTLFNSLNYLATKMDVLIIPKLLSTRGPEFDLVLKNHAAQYERANYAMTQPITIMGKLSDSVLFSGMAAMQDQVQQLRRTFLLATHWIGLVMWPAAGFIYYFSYSLIHFWLGPQYNDAAGILQILFFVAVFRTMSKLCDSLLRAKDHLLHGSAIKALYVISIVVAIAVTIDYGMRSVALAVVGATALHYLLNIWLTARILQLSLIEMLRSWVPALVFGAISAWSASGVQWALEHLEMNSILLLLLGSGLWALGMLIIVYLFPRLLGTVDMNPLYHLPDKIKGLPLLKRMIARLPERA